MSIGPAREGYCNKHRLHRKPCLVCAAEATPAPPLSETGPFPEAYWTLERVLDYFEGRGPVLFTADSERIMTKREVLEAFSASQRRSAHLQDARAGCGGCRLEGAPTKDETTWRHVGTMYLWCQRPEIWDALSLLPPKGTK